MKFEPNFEMDLKLEKIEVLIAQANTSESAGDKKQACLKYRQAANELLMLANENADENPQLAAAFSQRAQEFLERCNSQLVDGGVPTAFPHTAENDKEKDFEEEEEEEDNKNEMNAKISAAEHIKVVEEGEEDLELDTITDREIKVAAIAVGGTAGLIAGSLIGCTVIGGVAGGGTAAVLVDRDTKNGQRARKMGIWGAKMYRKFRKFDDQHQVVQKTKTGIQTVCSKTQQFADKHIFKLNQEAATSTKVEESNTTPLNPQQEIGENKSFVYVKA